MCWLLAIAGILLWIVGIAASLLLAFLLAIGLGELTCKLFKVRDADEGDKIGYGFASLVFLCMFGGLVIHVHSVICAEGFKALWF